jgi:hypothetical protein
MWVFGQVEMVKKEIYEKFFYLREVKSTGEIKQSKNVF